MGRSSKARRSRLLAPLHADRYERVQREKNCPKPFGSQSYGDVVRRTLFFQFRLAVDNLRDLLLSPIAIVAALLGLLRPDNPSWALDRLMMFGRATDRWINLFEEQETETAQSSSKNHR